MAIWKSGFFLMLQDEYILDFSHVPWPTMQTTVRSLGWNETSVIGFFVVDRFFNVVITLFFSQKK